MSEGLMILILALMAGAVAVDTTAVFQLMLSQPVVAGTLAGLVVGEPAIGLTVGLTLQLVWAGVLPVGGAAFPDAGVAAVVGAGLAGLLAARSHPVGWCVASGLILALVVGWSGTLMVTKLRRWNVRVAERARAAVLAGDLAGVRRAIMRAVGLRFAASTVWAAVIIVAALAVARVVLPDEGPPAYPALVWAAPVAVGAAVALSRGWGERWSVAVGLAAGALLVTLL